MSIALAIESVRAQTYPNWEMWIVDDCSTDVSAEIVRSYIEKDVRIHYLRTERASGSPAIPRNLGIEAANGRFIAFLDCDDIWLSNKLEKQLVSFLQKDIAIVYADYEKIDGNGNRNGRVIHSPQQVDYRQLLKGNVIGCSTAVYDTEKVGKVYLSKIGHEDFILWLDILKRGFGAVNAGDVLALYRETKKSVSSNKFRAIAWTWNIYRDVEHLTLFQSYYYFICYAVKSVIKYLK